MASRYWREGERISEAEFTRATTAARQEKEKGAGKARRARLLQAHKEEASRQAYREAQKGFTGKVEEVTPTGGVRETTYVFGGERIGKYKVGEEHFISDDDDKKTYELEFEEAGIKEKVKISPGEMFWGYEELPTSYVGETAPGYPLMISEYKPPTEAEIRESEYLRERYTDIIPTFISEPLSTIATGFKERIIEPISFFVGDLVGKKPPPEQEALTLVSEPTYGVGGTMVYRQPTIEDLSKEAGYYKTAVEEELVAGFDVETKLGEKRTEILKRISPEGITEEEARKANIELEKFHTGIIKESEIQFEEREQVRQQAFFPPGKVIEFLPEWKFDPEKFHRGLYFKEIPGIAPLDIKVATGALTFAAGAYEGIRTKPVKTALTAAAFVALPVGFKAISGLGKVAGVTSLGLAYPKTIAYVGKGVRYGMGGAYGATVVGRIGVTPGFYEKFGKAGEIVSTELLPMGVGWRIGAYGVRRYEAVAQLKDWAGKLPSGKKIMFEKQIIEAKAYGGIEPSVKEISLGKMEYIPKKAEKPLMEFLKRRKRELIVGGRVAEYTQVYPTPKVMGHDVDIYLKGLIPKIKARLYTRELAGELRGAGVGRVSIPPKHPTQITIAGKKAIEIHPYKEYLRYNIEQVLPWYKPAGMGITKTPSGIKVMKLPVQWKRMIVRGYFEKVEALGRAKVIRKSLIESARIQRREKFPQLFSYGEFTIPTPKGLKKPKIDLSREGISYKPKEVSDYPYYKPKIKTPFYPGYKPSKAFFDMPYKPVTKKKIPPYLPTKAPYKPIKPSMKPFITKPYKPTPSPPIFWWGDEEIIPSPPKKKKATPFGRLPGVPTKAEFLRATRIFKRTPSLLAVKRFEEFGITKKQLKKGLEVTGLFPREFGMERLPKIELPVTMIGKVTRKIIRKNKIKKIKKRKKK